MTGEQRRADAPVGGTARRVLVATLSNLFGRGASLVVVFLMIPFVLGELGTVAYGLWVLANAIAGWAELLDLGIGGAVIRFVAHHTARGETEEVNSLVATASWLYLLMGAVAFLVAVVLGLTFVGLFDVQPAYRDVASLTVFLVGLSTALWIAATPAASVLRGLQRYDLYNAVSVVTLIVSSVASVVVLLAGAGLVGLAATAVATPLLEVLLSYLAVRRVRPDLRIGYRGGRRALVRPILSFSMAVFAIQVAGRLQMKTDEIVIGAFLPLAAITPYSIARRLRDLAVTLSDQFAKVLFPLAAEVNASDDRARLREVYVTGTRLVLAMFAPLAVGLWLLGGPFVTAWVGAEQAQASTVLPILVLAALFDALTWPAGYVLQGIGRNRVLGWTAMATGLANLGVSIVLVQSMGLIGVAYGTLLPQMIEAVAVVVPYSTRVLRVDVRALLAGMLLPVVLPALAMAGVVALLARLLDPQSIPLLLAVGGIGGVVYAALYLALPVAAPERRVVWGVLGALRHAVAR